jgi:hypothetical protein
VVIQAPVLGAWRTVKEGDEESVKGSKRFFFEKKKQKTSKCAARCLERNARPVPGRRAAPGKVFCFFFTKKKRFLT